MLIVLDIYIYPILICVSTLLMIFNGHEVILNNTTFDLITYLFSFSFFLLNIYSLYLYTYTIY